MTYYEFEDLIWQQVGNLNEEKIKKFWNVYVNYYNSFGPFIDLFLDVLLFLYEKDNELREDDLTILFSILIPIKKEFYMRDGAKINYKFVFPKELLEYNTPYNENLCSIYLKELEDKNISFEEKIEFTYNYYSYYMLFLKEDAKKSDLIEIVNLNFYLQKCFETLIDISIIKDSIIDCYKNYELLGNINNKLHWCIGNILAKGQNNYYDFANFIKQVIDEEIININDIDVYIILGMVNNVVEKENIFKINNDVIAGQKYFMNLENEALDISISINDYLHDLNHEEKKVDFILGIIKEGIKPKEEKCLIMN